MKGPTGDTIAVYIRHAIMITGLTALACMQAEFLEELVYIDCADVPCLL